MPSRLRSLVLFGLAAFAGCGVAAPALAQNRTDVTFQPAADLRTPQRFDTWAASAELAPDRFRQPAAQPVAQPVAIERSAGLAPVESGAGVTGFDATNARRIRARPRSAAPAPSLSAAEIATARAISREAQQLYRRDVVPPPPGVAGDAATPVIVPVHRRRPPEQDYFAPLGMRTGAFTWFPAMELVGGYDSNPLRLNSGKPGAFYASINPELMLRSDWQRHALNAEMRSSYLWYDRTFGDVTEGEASFAASGVPQSLDRPSVEALVNGRLDTYGASHADAEARFSLGTDNPGSPNIMAGLAKLPIYTRIGGSLGYTQNFNRLDVTLKGGIAA